MLIHWQTITGQTDLLEDNNLFLCNRNHTAAAPLLQIIYWLTGENGRWSSGHSIHVVKMLCWGVFLPLHSTWGWVCMSSVVCKYCPSRSVELLCTQPQLAQQTLPTPLFLFARLDSPLLHSLLSNQSHFYYCIYLNHTSPRRLFLSLSMNDMKQHDWGGKYCGLESLATNPTTHIHVLLHTHSRTPSFC